MCLNISSIQTQYITHHSDIAVALVLRQSPLIVLNSNVHQSSLLGNVKIDASLLLEERVVLTVLAKFSGNVSEMIYHLN